MKPVLPANPCRSLDVLVPEFRAKVDLLYPKLKSLGYEFRPVFTQRNVWEQAVLWRQSRAKYEIDTALSKLHTAGAHFLAEVLESVGPQTGPWATNALPGTSYHQWCEALDSMLVVNGVAVWDASHPGYVALAREAEALGLTSRRAMKDADHVQLRSIEPPSLYGWAKIDAVMKERYGTTQD